MTTSGNEGPGKSGKDGKISILRPDEASFIERTLRMYREQARTAPPDNGAPNDQELNSAREVAHRAESEGLSSSSRETIDLANCVIGLALMVTGLAAIVIVAQLPPKSLGWVFIVSGILFLAGGAYRIDKATKSFRRRERKGLPPDSPRTSD
jgi:hypothetical protein